jgi:hypothetical protein
MNLQLRNYVSNIESIIKGYEETGSVNKSLVENNTQIWRTLKGPLNARIKEVDGVRNDVGGKLSEQLEHMHRTIFGFGIVTTVIMFMALWTVANFMQWILHNAEWNLLFVRITSILSGFITIFFVYFSYGLVRVKINLKKKLLFLVPYLGIIALIFLKRDLQFFNMTDCEYAMDGFFMLYDYLFEIAYFLS